MRDFSTKQDNTAPAASGILKAEEDNVRFLELEKAVSSSGQALDPAAGPDTDTSMLARASYLYASGAQWFQDQGVKNAVVLNPIGGWVKPTALFSGMWARFIPGFTNDGNVTANVAGLGVKSVLDWKGAELGSGALTQDRPTEMFFSVTSDAWILLPWADARNVSGDATADPGGDPTADAQLIAMGAFTDQFPTGDQIELNPLGLGAADGDLMVVAMRLGADNDVGVLNDITVPAGWDVNHRSVIAPSGEPSNTRELVVASEVFVGAPPSSVIFSLQADPQVAYSYWIIRNATVVETPTVHSPVEQTKGFVTYNVNRDVSQAIILAAALESGMSKNDVTGAEGAQFSGLQQTTRDATPVNGFMALAGTTTAEGVSTVSFTTDQVKRKYLDAVWIPIS